MNGLAVFFAKNEKQTLLNGAIVLQLLTGVFSSFGTKSFLPFWFSILASILLVCFNKMISRDFLNNVFMRFGRCKNPSNLGAKAALRRAGVVKHQPDSEKQNSKQVSKQVSKQNAETGPRCVLSKESACMFNKCDKAPMVPPMVTSDTTVDDKVVDVIQNEYKDCEFPVYVRRPEVNIYEDGMDLRLRIPQGVGDPYSGGFRLWR